MNIGQTLTKMVFRFADGHELLTQELPCPLGAKEPLGTFESLFGCVRRRDFTMPRSSCVSPLTRSRVCVGGIVP